MVVAKGATSCRSECLPKGQGEFEVPCNICIGARGIVKINLISAVERLLVQIGFSYDVSSVALPILFVREACMAVYIRLAVRI